MPTSSSIRTAWLAVLLASTAPLLQVSASDGAQGDSSRLGAVKQWKAEVIVTSDCDRVAADGTRTVIHNRIATTYEFNRRLSDKPVLTWSGRASTTYRWSVGVELRDRRDIEESSASFDSAGTLELTDSTKITIGRLPGRPFTRKRYLGDVLVDTSTANDEPPAAELNQAPLPSDSGTGSGSRTEDAYSLLGGLVLPCPAQRQWTIRAAF